MSQQVSPSTGPKDGVKRVCRVLEIPRSTVYARRARRMHVAAHAKRGPRVLTDDAILAAVQEDLATTPWVGEGHRKVHARLRMRGVRTSKGRVLRVMRAHGLLAPTRTGNAHGPRAHDGSTVANRPDEMWATDGKTVQALWEGSATVFIVVDHCTLECLGIHASKRGTRREAVEALHQAVRHARGGFRRDIAAGTTVRLAPPYDLVCTSAWPRWSRRRALSVGGTFDAGNVGSRAWARSQETVEQRAPRGHDAAEPAIDLRAGAGGKARNGSVDHRGWHVSHR